MAELQFWFHPDASAEAFWIHDHYFDVSPTLAEDFQTELERSRSVIARSPSTWPQYIHGTQRYLMKRLQQRAKELGVDPRDLAKAAVNDLLNRPADDFGRAAKSVLDKNRQLYRRLG